MTTSSTATTTATITAATSASSSGGTGGGPTTYCASLSPQPTFCDDFESGTLASWAASMPDGFQGTNDSNAGKPPSLRSLSLANANSAPTNV